MEFWSIDRQALPPAFDSYSDEQKSAYLELKYGDMKDRSSADRYDYLSRQNFPSMTIDFLESYFNDLFQEYFQFYEGQYRLKDAAFSGCSQLSAIHLPDGLEKIGKYAFSECVQLSSIELPKNLREMGAGVFGNCHHLSSIHLPDGLERIGDSAFWRCSHLSAIQLPKNLQEIGPWAFSQCSNLSAIHLPDGLEKIGKYAFSECVQLSSIELPKNLQEIGPSAFSGCSQLSAIHLPDGLERIGDSAFWRCSHLSSIQLPKNLQEIGPSAFWGCTHLKYVIYLGDEQNIIQYFHTVHLSVTIVGQDDLPELFKDWDRSDQSIYIDLKYTWSDQSPQEQLASLKKHYKEASFLYKPFFIKQFIKLQELAVSELKLKDKVQRDVCEEVIKYLPTANVYCFFSSSKDPNIFVNSISEDPSLRAMESQRRVVSSRSSLFCMNKIVDTQYNDVATVYWTVKFEYKRLTERRKSYVTQNNTIRTRV
jgi:hypothetical protein